MIFMYPFSAWFKFNKDQIKSNYYKITSLDRKQLNVQLNQKAKHNLVRGNVCQSRKPKAISSNSGES